MSDDYIIHLDTRVKQLETLIASMHGGITKYDLERELDARDVGETAAMKKLAAEIKELRAQLTTVATAATSFATKSDLMTAIKSGARGTGEILVEVMADESIKLEKRIDDATRAVAADARKAQQAAAASIDLATKAFAEYCAELGA